MVETKVKTEKRKLAMHPKLLMDTIMRQAGTLQKANLEGVMNALEAGSPVVRIELTTDGDRKARLSIGDDGIGIETKEEMIQHFETFGTPHDASENTTWKQFRMGRGQMFAFGRNVWRTATFKMIVDIKKNGLSYELHENLPYVKGCHIDIDLYQNPIGYSYASIEQYKESITEQIRFMEGKILFNGEQINTPASKYNWDLEDDDAYYLFNVGTDFKVYNLGAFVMNGPLYEMGMLGVVVSKKQVKVNFARNDIQHDCEIYNRIKNIVKQNRIKKTRKARRSLSSWERIATLKDLRDKTQELGDIQTLALIPTAQGKYIAINVIRKMKQQWCFAPCGDRFADRLMEREQAICISEEILTDLGYTGKKSRFFSWLTNNENRECYGQDEWVNIAILYKDFKELREGISDTYQTIPTNKYTPSERRIINVLQEQGCWHGRQILLGYSDTASGWTDGSSYICIDRNWLKKLSITFGPHCAKIQMLLAHEMAHDDDSQGTHIHGPEFYEKMVFILESCDSPLGDIADFKYTMEKSRIQERRVKEETKKEKAKDKVNTKLGIAAKEK